jgi:hypothetical protein
VAGAELLPPAEVVELHDDAVHLVRQAIPLLEERFVEAGDLVDARGGSVVRIGREPPALEGPEHLPVRSEAGALDAEHVVEDGGEGMARDLARVELSHQARRRVARIGEGLVSLLHAFAVHRLEALALEEDLSAHRELCGGRSPEPQGNGANGLQVSEMSSPASPPPRVAPWWKRPLW